MPRRDDWEPAVGNDEEEGGVGIRMRTLPNGDRQATLLPASVRRLTDEQFELTYQAQRRALAAQQLRAELDDLAVEMRSAGISWGAIGWSVGLTGEAARLRWGDVDA